MNSFSKIFIGIFFVFAFAWMGLVALPYIYLGKLQPQVNEETGEVYPVDQSGLAAYGAKVYAANGCMYCHSQQVRPEYAGSDIERGWGVRRTVPRDYIHESPVYLGTMRTGPDLTNIGARQPSEAWQHQHLYSPQLFEPDSIMPPYRYLYKKQRIVGQPSEDAIQPPPSSDLEDGYEIVPTYEAKALVAYLLSLNRSASLEEAPVAE